EQKIFAERGLATPFPDRVRRARRGVLAAQVAVAVLALVLAAGTGWSYYRVRQMRAGYAALLTRGAELLEQRQQMRQGERTIGDRDRLSQSRQFLEQAQALDGRRLATIFMPAAWVDPLDAGVSQRLTRVLEGVVLADLRDGLTHRAQEWLAGAVPPADASSGGPSVKDNPHYQALERFAADYQGMVENLRRYDALSRGAATDLTATSDLLAYLGAGPLASPAAPAPVVRAVRAARTARIDCRIFEGTDPAGASLVGQRASALLDVFGTRSFGDENPVLLASTAFTGDWTAIVDGARDQDALLDLIGHTADLSTAVTTWAPIGSRSKAIALPVFDTPPFRPIAADARLCPAVRPDLTPAITRITGQRDVLSDRLVALDVEPFGPLVVAGEQGLALGDGVAGLKAEFDTLQREPFWSPPSGETDGVLPANPVWRADVIDDVVKVVDAYDLYRGRAFGQMTIDDRRELLVPVLSQVSRLVAARLVVTATGGPGPAADPAVRVDEIGALGAQLAKVTRLVPLLTAAPPAGGDVLQALDAQASRALQDLDRIAATRYPAVFGRQPADVYVAWADLQKTAPGPDGIKQWGAAVDATRTGIQQLARAAQPLVQYMTVRQPSDLARRWSSVVADVTGYETKQPGNGLVGLDAILRDGVPTLSPEKNCAPPAVATGTTPFTQAQKQIVDEGVRRCRADIEARYAAIAASFNQLLAGKVPFSRDLTGAPEATLDEVGQFLATYERQQGGLLRPAFEARACAADALPFVRSIDAAATVLAGIRAATPPALALDVLPEFRVASARDIGGDQIAQWQFDAGEQRVVDGAAAKPVPWAAGDPVALTIRFARDSPSRPDSVVPNAQMTDRTVQFAFGGQWAVFQLVRAGRSSTGDLARVADLAPTMLGIQVPVVRDPETPPLAGPEPASPFRLFLRLRLFAPGKTDALPVDVFPTQAPVRLSCPVTE
ncbi:MAG: hypothetical protein AB7I13_19225, partial [Vicinamibacterales bacterium]